MSHIVGLFICIYVTCCSRSQCIINIHHAPDMNNGELGVQANNAVLAIVDLAGAEREKKTGNQVQKFTYSFGGA